MRHYEIGGELYVKAEDYDEVKQLLGRALSVLDRDSYHDGSCPDCEDCAVYRAIKDSL